MLITSLEKVVNEGVISTEIADSYLRIYVADIDWNPHLSKLWSNTKNKIKDEDQSKIHIKKVIACTTLLPYYDKTVIPENPQNLLFWSPTWNQFNEKDWLSLYREVVKKDIEIRGNRRKIVSYGIVEAIDYLPLTRQAFNWLYAKAEGEGCVSDSNKQEIIKKFQNLVKVYGGAIICNMFSKYESNIGKVLNWRTGYFIEKEIYKVYSLDQIIKIKQTEISKIDTKYVKTLTKSTPGD